MLLPVFQDLIKPRWRKVLEELKLSGPLPVSELAIRIGASYMAVKQQCEELKGIGYLARRRVARTEVGRPEIFYHLTEMSDGLFPQAGMSFTLELLDSLKVLYGETFADKLLFQYFEKQQNDWQKRLGKLSTLVEKTQKFLTLRAKEGYLMRWEYDPGSGFKIEIHHNPLQRVFDLYPRTIAMEHRMLEQILGCRILRREPSVAAESTGKLILEIPAKQPV